MSLRAVVSSAKFLRQKRAPPRSFLHPNGERLEGKILSHFRILSKIGQGGMGVVYKAEDTNLGRTVAIKVLPADLVQDPKRRARFVTEARTAAAVTHPNIATIYEIDEADGATFIAMEYLQAETLRARMAAHPLQLKQALQLGAEIAAGLAAAHGANIVHRDLKPDNVMITHDGHAKILDFGLARLLDPPTTSAGAAAELAAAQTQAVTDPGQVVGTPAYMSPEQARGLELDFRTDIFSFGCTFYEMLTGHRPFRGATSTDTLSDILTKDPVPATTVKPDLPSSVQWVLEKCLDKEASERYQDTRDLVVDLHHLQRECQNLTSSSRPPATPQAPAAGVTTPQPTPSGQGSAGFGVQTPTPQSMPSAPTLQSAAGVTTTGVTPASQAPARKRFVGLAVAVVTTAAVVFGLSRLFERSPTPKHVAEANSLAIFAFENLKDSTDPQRYGQIFQDVLITALSGLEPLKVYSGQRLFDIQKQLSHGRDDVFDREITTDVARRAGAEHMLTGSLGQLGEKWILTCQMVQVADGTVVFSKRIDGDDLYQVADVLTSELKDDLRIAAPSEVSQEISVREKTSSSLDAYRKYLEGNDLLNTNKYQEAAEVFRKAIEIDPGFGQAYYKLAAAVSWPGDNPDAAKAIYDEFLSRELYTSDKEKRLAESARARLDNQFAEILPKQRELVLDYPDEKDAWYELGETLFHFPGGGKEEEALEAFEKAISLDPDFLLPYQHIFDAFWRDRRYDDALERARALIRRDPENPTWHRFKAGTLAFTTPESGIDAVVTDALRYQKTPEDRRELYKEVATKLWAQAPAKQEEYLKKALAADPDHDDATIVQQLMQLLVNRARWDEYENWVQDELEKNPENSVMQGRLQWVYDRTRRYDDALTFVRQWSREKPDDPRPARRWVRLAILSGDEKAIGTALDAADQATQSTDDRRMLLETVAWAYSARGDHNRSLDSFRETLALDPDGVYPHLYGGMAWRQYARGRYDAARRDFQKAIELNPNDRGAHFGLVRLAADQRDDAAVDSLVDRLLETLPPGPFQVLGPAGQHLRAGRLEQARALYEEYVRRPNPDWVTLNSLTQIGDAYLDEGYVQDALEMFQRAAELEVSRRLPVALNNVGLCQLVAGNYAEGERTLRSALVVQYPNRVTRTRLASAQILLGKFDDAETTLKNELEFRPHPYVDQLLVLVRAGQARFQEARRLAERCVAMDSSRVSHEILAWTLIAGDLDVDRGIREAERALELPIAATNQFHQLPCWPPAEHSLGLALLKKGTPDQAVAHLRRAAERIPGRESLLADLRRAETIASGTP
jgi:serine/threonine protein kinase/tetratricopeptide (TPR) repeat protein